MLQLLYDGLLWISEGKNRKETSWKNKEISWHDLVLRLSKSVSTSETLAEYLAFSKDIQAEKKDVGGFVGGLVQGGRRKAGSVSARYLLTLDIEGSDVPPGQGAFWSDFRLVYSEAAFLYGTHKNSPEAPHLRLVLPLSREVFPDEYQALGRKVAETLGIDLFDPTTFQPERLMYWGSVPKDVVYYTELQDGPWLNVDAVLALYGPGNAWQDTSQWAIGKRANKAIATAALKQGDPTGKPGIIGAFCRTYTVTEAIARFLPDVYTPTDDPGRYTYMGGSTAAGLIIYEEDKFAFSHHGTDPISGRLCNVFDLVRIHKFGKGDDEVKAGTPINKYPSYAEVCELAVNDKAISRELALTKVRQLKEDFEDIELPGEVKEHNIADDTWAENLKCDKRGSILVTIHNCLYILQNDPKLKNCFGYNRFEHSDTVLSNFPWRKIDKKGEELKPLDESALRNYMERNYQICSPAKIKDALIENRTKVAYHPVIEYLDGLLWDKTHRIDTLLIDYFGVEDTLYTRSVIRKSLTAAVARVYEPGSKFDNVLTIIGEEGKGKSTFFDRLGGAWYSNSLGPVDSPKVTEQLQGVWIIEMAELASFKKADIDHVKHFCAKREDRFRVAYGTRVELFPRQCVFFGTTNTPDFLISANGNRRFWPAQADFAAATLSVFTDLTVYEVGQIWAEAVLSYRSGEPLFLSPAVERMAFEKQEQHTEHDDREEIIRKYLETPVEGSTDLLEDDGPRMVVTMAEIWHKALGGRLNDMTCYNTKPIHNIMKKMKGWERIQIAFRSKDFGVQKGYKRV